VCSVMLAQSLLGHAVSPPPPATALGGVLTHLARGAPAAKDYQPSNVTWAWLPPHENRRLKKRDRYEALAARALGDLERWIDSAPLASVRPPAVPALVAEARSLAVARLDVEPA